MGIITAVAIVVGCLTLAAFFSAAETALLRLRQHEIEEEIEARRGPAALAIRDLLASTSRLLVTILLGNNVANILGASVAAAVAIRYLGVDVGIAVSTVVMTFFVFVFCEVLPKAVAAQHPRGIANAVALPLYLLNQVLRPLHLLFDRFLNPFVARVVGSSGGEQPSSAEEILRLAREVQHGNEHRGSPVAIMGAVAGAAKMTVTDIMVERTQIVAFPVDIDPEDLLERVLAERYTRVPIYEESIDQILGVIHFKELVQLVKDRGADLRPTLKNVIRVPERKPILQLLTDMQRSFLHMAVVKDEFGVTLGIVTQEDILEELVGEIRDEFDREELLTIAELPDGTFEALGRIKVLDFNRETSWNIPAERGDTLAGLVFNELGRAPQRGESVRVPGYEIRVVDVSGSRVTQVRVRATPGSEESPGNSGLLSD